MKLKFLAQDLFIIHILQVVGVGDIASTYRQPLTLSTQLRRAGPDSFEWDITHDWTNTCTGALAILNRVLKMWFSGLSETRY